MKKPNLTERENDNLVKILQELIEIKKKNDK